jgi:hypothetical protein
VSEGKGLAPEDDAGAAFFFFLKIVDTHDYFVQAEFMVGRGGGGVFERSRIRYYLSRTL